MIQEFGLDPAFAANGLQCMDTTQGKDVTGIDVNVNDSVSCVGVSDKPKSAWLSAIATDTEGNVISVGKGGYVPGTTMTLGFSPSLAVMHSDGPNGVWHVVYTYYTLNGIQVGRETADFGVSFFVLPESRRGVVPLTGSSMATLGAFVAYRKRNAGLSAGE